MIPNTVQGGQIIMETVVPESLSEVTDLTQLEELENTIQAEFDAKYDSDDKVPLAELREIADALKAVRARIADVHAEQAAEQAERDGLAEEVNASKPAPAVENDTEVDTEVDAEPAPAEADAVEVVDAEPVEVADVEREPVAASARRSAPAAHLARRGVEPPSVPTSDMAITAAADIPGVPVGSTLDRLALAKAFMARARGLANGSPRIGIASVDTGIPQAHRIGERDDADAVLTAAVQSTLAGKDAAALVASGGFCALSETMYELFSIEGRDGLVDLPTVGISRGGISVPSYVGLGAVSAGLWAWSEANDETPGSDGDATKPCLQVPCPTFTDYRLGAEGLCITAGNMIDRAYPEMVARTVDLAMTGHMRRVSAAVVADIVADATAVTVTTAPSDAAGDLLSAIDLQVADYRSQYSMSVNAVLDAVFPDYVLGMVRSSIAMRAGIDAFAVTDEQVRAYFTARNVRPQFVLDYEPLYSAAPATAWPATTSFLLFPTGGYVMGDGGEIDLGVVRDSTLNETNDFTAAWSEQFYVTIVRGPAAREVTVTSAVTGQTGGPALVAASA